MPYSISTEAEDCNGFAVVKDDDNFIMGCHDTEQEAQDQITALNIAEAESERQSIPSQDLYETQKEAEDKAKTIQELDREKLEKKFSNDDKEKLN